MRLDGGDVEEEEGRAYMTVEVEREEFAREKRCMVRRMSIPTNSGVRHRCLGSLSIVYNRVDALVEESLVHEGSLKNRGCSRLMLQDFW